MGDLLGLLPAHSRSSWARVPALGGPPAFGNCGRTLGTRFLPALMGKEVVGERGEVRLWGRGRRAWGEPVVSGWRWQVS